MAAESSAGTVHAILELGVGCATLPKATGWGGARNRRDRASDALTLAQVQSLWAAAERAAATGRPLNRHVTIHFGALGIADRDAAAAVTRYLKLWGDWARRRGYPVAWCWVRENDAGDGAKGSHVHILAHLPPGADLRRVQRGWVAKLTSGNVPRGAVLTRRVGGGANLAHSAPEKYRSNLAAVLAYVSKGADRATAHALGLKRWGEGGRIIGKRCGWSAKLTI